LKYDVEKKGLSELEILGGSSAGHSVHKEGPYAVFKDKFVKERWNSELDPYIVSQITQDIEGTRLARFLT
jgi:hypothetical protein